MQLLEKIKPIWSGRAAQERHILVINGHPDPAPERFCSALCDAYEEGADKAGWMVRRLTVGLLSNIETREQALEDMQWATQLVVVYPLWLDQPPVQLRDLFEENLAHNQRDGGGVSDKPVHLVITMDMPAFLYRAMLQCEIDVKGLTRGMTLRVSVINIRISSEASHRSHRSSGAGGLAQCATPVFAPHDGFHPYTLILYSLDSQYTSL